ncbi:type I-F CRISPR-associated protein Csy3 [Glaciimonas sp. PAMC28666]|uniref:type I-F CRISPR-associated protein Csy3 n=1 Tax=Glaciimonas sp. PAMC28666 TaxID=2807626 RepID=UPI0019663BC4|nr:type I-F CRISPR-associated protein Csy3 [Glaciimonas sp. PAMC28666]QRX80827.1 type I-F CRISPR-associated protein Csy3 [Glaciimonas sp. PAMC28666]
MTSTQTFSKVPSVFSFQRSMIVSAGAFFNDIAGQNDLSPLYVVRHGLRGTQNVSEAGDTAKGTKDRDVSNIQQTETALLDHRADALVVKFGLRMVDLDSALFACASGDRELAKLVRESVVDFVARAKSSDGLKEVSRRIARNVANGSFLWRNRVLAKSVSITTIFNGNTLTFNALGIPLSSFGDYSADEITLSEIIADGLRGNRDAAIEVMARVDFGVKGAVEVYPSQAYVENKPKGFARPLYKLTAEVPHANGIDHQTVMGQAALRDQKISNRLRTIDTWYDAFDIVGKPLPVEPNGASIDLMSFFRSGKSTAFSMLSRLNQIDPSSPEGMFCIGSMIRGGVYSGGSEKAEVKANAKTESTMDNEANEAQGEVS